MSDTIEIISWNVNGIRAVGNKEALRWIDQRQPDILCLQEIKALPEQIPANLFETEFTTLHVNSADKKGYSGTATFSQLTPQQTYNRHDIDLAREGRIIEQDFGDFVLFNIYFPNGQKMKSALSIR